MPGGTLAAHPGTAIDWAPRDCATQVSLDLVGGAACSTGTAGVSKEVVMIADAGSFMQNIALETLRARIKSGETAARFCRSRAFFM